jgi:succinate-acetate transporter protein
VSAMADVLPASDAVAETAASPRGRAASAPLMADPMPMAYGLFGFALAAFGLRFMNVEAETLASNSTSIAVTYAVLVAGIAQTVAGVLGIVRGMGYPAYVTSTFGIWLLGFYLLATTGAEDEAFTPNALAWYVLLLLVPVAIMAVPAFVHRNIPFSIAFVAVIAALLFFGLGYHNLYEVATAAAKTKTTPDLSTAVSLVKASGWAAWAAAAAVWFVFAKEVYHLTGVLGGGRTRAAH